MLDLFLSVFTILSIYLSQLEAQQFRKWACIFGLLAQPFWFYLSFYPQLQWGILAVTVFITLSWLNGFYLYWIKGRITK